MFASKNFFQAGGTAVAPNIAFTDFYAPATMSSTAFKAYGVAVNSSGRFVAVGFGQYQFPRAAYSSDGITWSTPALMGGSTVDTRMYAVTVNSSGLFVAVGARATNAVASYSSDGITWTAPALMNGLSTTGIMYGVAVNSSGLFVAVGPRNSGIGVAAYSSDGMTWSTPALMNGSTALNWMHAVTVNSSGLFVAVGYGNNSQPAFATSTNGMTWTTPADMNGSGVVAYMNGVAVNSSGLFAAVGYNSSGYPVAAYSTNGTTWTTPATMNGSTTPANMAAVSVNTTTGKFVAVGIGDGNSNTGYPVWASSTDGITWTTPVLMNATNSLNSSPTAITVTNKGKHLFVGFVPPAYNCYPAVFAASWDSAYTARPSGSRTYFGCNVDRSYSWVAPSSVTSVSVVAVGRGSCGNFSGYGGGLGYKGNYAVTPGSSYSVAVVGATTNGYSYFVSSAVVGGKYGKGGSGGTYVGDGGGNGGVTNRGGGGAGGYSGAGGAGGTTGVGVASTGGGGGGGGGASTSYGGGGGGVGLYGAGGNGAGGALTAQGAQGGSQGPLYTVYACNPQLIGYGGTGVCSPGHCEYVHTCCSYSYPVYVCPVTRGGSGGLYGGGQGLGSGCAGGYGAVRIVWPGNTRTFPSTCVSTP